MRLTLIGVIYFAVMASFYVTKDDTPLVLAHAICCNMFIVADLVIKEIRKPKTNQYKEVWKQWCDKEYAEFDKWLHDKMKNND